jgi:rSAM/selenodomain-associated transferase 1
VAHEIRAGTGSRDRVKLGVGVMARAPSSRGKTRLAPHLSESRLRALRRALLADTLRTAAREQPPSPLATSVPPSDLRPRQGPPSPSATSVPARNLRPRLEVIVFVDPGDASSEVEALSATPITCVPQVDGDLGSRMRAAGTHLIQTLNCDAAILIGSDIPLLTGDHLREACETLSTTGGVVVGPADDGGYYLIGMRTVHTELFEGIAWGTSSVLTDTLRIADRAGIEASLIRPAYDVDTIEDLQRLERDLRNASPDLAPHVREWFRAG